MNTQREESISSLSNQGGEVPVEVHAYLDQHKIESTLTKAFNRSTRRSSCLFGST